VTFLRAYWFALREGLRDGWGWWWWDADFHRWLAAEVRDGQFTAQVGAVRAPETLAAISLAAFAALAVSGYRDHRRRALERALAPVDAALDELEGV